MSDHPSEGRPSGLAAAGAAPGGGQQGAGEASLRALLRQLVDDSRGLVRQEIALAKVEVREGVQALAKGAVLIGLGAAILLVGLLVLTAFLVLGLGRLLDGQYWLSSLIVGGLFALLGALTLLAGKKGLARGELKPTVTAETLRENQAWAREEIRQLKRDLAT
jgi:uncharacterized membrane protein YqjE